MKVDVADSSVLNVDSNDCVINGNDDRSSLPQKVRLQQFIIQEKHLFSEKIHKRNYSLTIIKNPKYLHQLVSFVCKFAFSVLQYVILSVLFLYLHIYPTQFHIHFWDIRINRSKCFTKIFLGSPIFLNDFSSLPNMLINVYRETCIKCTILSKCISHNGVENYVTQL